MEFCKAFNAKTAQMEKGMPIPVIITVYQDKSFTFEMKQPPVSFFLKKAAKIEKGSQTPGRGAGRLGHQGAGARDRREEDGRPQLLRPSMPPRMIEGSARSMGLEVTA